MKKRKLLLLVFAAGFITNLVWENAQAPLYEGYESFSQHFVFCLAASAVDGAIVVLLYVLVFLIRKNMFWLLHSDMKDVGIIVIFGALTAIVFEIVALKNGLWNYTKDMPLVFGLGLIPLMQLSILPALSIYLLKTIIQKKNKKLLRNNFD